MSPDFDLDCLDELQAAQDQGLEVPILKPGTQDVLFTIRVAGPDSAQQARAMERAQEEAIARGAQTPLTREENEAANVLYLARCCMAWTAKDKAGANIPFTEGNVVAMLGRYKLVRSTVDAAAANRVRFIKRSPTASADASVTA